MKFSKIVIDGNNLYHRNYSVFQNKFDQAISGFLKSIQKLQREYAGDNCQFYILFDNRISKDSQRKLIDPDYKANRKSKDEGYAKGIEILQNILLNYSNDFFIIYRHEYEADDFVYPLIKYFKNGERILLVSMDFDWMRCISKDVFVLKHNDLYDVERFVNEYGFIPTVNSVVLYKTFTGDASDNIPIGVLGLKKDTILKIVSEYKNIYDFLNCYTKLEYISIEMKEKIKQAVTRLKLNYQLVSFCNINEEDFSESIYSCKFNPSTLRNFYKAMEFKISEVDKRLMNGFPEPDNKKDTSGFFRQQKIKRM